MVSSTERGKGFQILCAKALKRAMSRDFDMEVAIPIGPESLISLIWPRPTEMS